MDHANGFYFTRNDTPTAVRVLVFNGALNIYDAETNGFIKSSLFKGTTISKDEQQVFIGGALISRDTEIRVSNQLKEVMPAYCFIQACCRKKSRRQKTL